MNSANSAVVDGMPPAQAPRALLEGLRDEHGLYLRLETLSERQHELVSLDDPKDLLKVLAERESVTAQLSKLGRALAAMRREWPVLRKQLTEQERAEADRLVSASSQIAGRIMSRDAGDVQRLAVRKRSAAQDAEKTRDSRAALVSYRPIRSGAVGRGNWQG